MLCVFVCLCVYMSGEGLGRLRRWSATAAGKSERD